MNNIKVSIVVCSYNQQEYIKETLESIVSQVHPYSWEIIVCDDASSDSTPFIIDNFSLRYKEIIPVIREKNIGVVRNLFDGISRSNGEYIMVCGGDDCYLPNKILTQIEYLEKNKNIGLLYGDVQTISKRGENLRKQYGQPYSSLSELLRKYSIPAPTMAFRRMDILKYIDEINPCDKNWLMEDVPLSIWFFSNNKLGYLPGVVVNYRILNESICHQKTPYKMLEFEKSTFSVLEYFQTRYPNLISQEFIIWRHLTSLLNRPNLVSNYKDYCYSILSKYDKIEKNKSHLIYRLRIKYKIINKFFRLTRLVRKGGIYIKNLYFRPQI